MARRRVRVRINQSAVLGLTADPKMRDLLLQSAGPLVSAAQGRAPKLTGLGAASIDAEAVPDRSGWTVHISWSRERYYMYFHEVGTKTLPARPFLASTLEGLS